MRLIWAKIGITIYFNGCVESKSQMSSNHQLSGKLNLAGCQITDTSGLFAETQHQPNRKKDKTGLRKVLEKNYESAFIPPIISQTDTAALIRDGT